VDAVGAGERCVLAVRPENVVLGSGGENAFSGRIAFASYLGDTLRYDVETESGLVIKVDVRDSWHHRLLPVGEPLQLGFPASAVLTLPDE
jgi:ABC-type Fe3+/spermidine/putrescine transport system ATPase subunit